MQADPVPNDSDAEAVAAEEALVKRRSFAWILKGRLGGMKFPSAEVHVRRLHAIGVRLVVSLWEQPWLDTLRTMGLGTVVDRMGPLLEELGIECMWIPCRDHSVPDDPSTLLRALKRMDEVWAEGHAAVAHCTAGHGRTGLFLTSALMWLGWHPMVAIDHIQQVRGAHGRAPQWLYGLHYLDKCHKLSDTLPLMDTLVRCDPAVGGSLYHTFRCARFRKPYVCWCARIADVSLEVAVDEWDLLENRLHMFFPTEQPLFPALPWTQSPGTPQPMDVINLDEYRVDDRDGNGNRPRSCRGCCA